MLQNSTNFKKIYMHLIRASGRHRAHHKEQNQTDGDLRSKCQYSLSSNTETYINTQEPIGPDWQAGKESNFPSPDGPRRRDLNPGAGLEIDQLCPN
mgnify:FL=1